MSECIDCGCPESRGECHCDADVFGPDCFDRRPALEAVIRELLEVGHLCPGPEVSTRCGAKLGECREENLAKRARALIGDGDAMSELEAQLRKIFVPLAQAMPAGQKVMMLCLMMEEDTSLRID